MYRRSRTLVATLALLLLAGGCDRSGGEPGGQANGSHGRTMQIDMVDVAFEPAQVTVSNGEAVTFHFTNSGKVAHEAFIGDAQAQAEHEADMMAPAMPHGDHGGEPGESLMLEPGSSGTLTYVFDKAGQVEIGCHEPGHYAAGMKVAVTVT
jgi:uncharacterized cupredoxin-like copper-binding protein